MSWAIKYRPTDLDGLILHPDVREDLEIFYKLPAADTPNLLFYGEPGRGKTAVARIFSEKKGYGEIDFHDLSQPENQTKAAQRNIISIVTQKNTLRSFLSGGDGRHRKAAPSLLRRLGKPHLLGHTDCLIDLPLLLGGDRLCHPLHLHQCRVH